VKISEVQIAPVKPQGGLVAFASFVLENALYCGSVAILTRPNGGFRLLYPTKPVAGQQVDVFHPISGDAGKQIERAVLNKYEEVMNYGRNRYDNPNTSTD
jgi:DNA-binding cell septation regulator SpoVG